MIASGDDSTDSSVCWMRGDRLGLDVHIVFHEEIEALPHGALQDVLKRDHAERALAAVHGGEGLPEILAAGNP